MANGAIFFAALHAVCSIGLVAQRRPTLVLFGRLDGSGFAANSSYLTREQSCYGDCQAMKKVAEFRVLQ